MKKIAFLINSLGKGGAERVAVNLAAHFYSQGYEILFVTSRELPEEYVVSFPARRRLLEREIAGAPMGRVGRMPARVWRLRRIWREERPDMIIALVGKMNLYAIVSAAGIQIPVFLSVRSDPAREYPSPLQKKLADVLFRRAAGVIFQTREAADAFPAAVRARAAVLPNALDASFVKPRYEGRRRPEIVMVGRLDANKNHEMLLRVFADMQETYPHWRVRIYGSGLHGTGGGPEENTEPLLRMLVQELEIDDKVDFMGRQTNIREKIEAASVFVLVPDYEGMPNALLEAMATGLAVIATDCPCGGPRSVIQNGKNGILIPVGDEQALATALHSVMGDAAYADALGREAAKLAAELSPERVCGLWQKEIESRVSGYVGRKS